MIYIPLSKIVSEGKILLANPFSDVVRRRIEQQPDPAAAWSRVHHEVVASIRLLKSLKAAGKPVKLKLYSDLPLVRLAILGNTCGSSATIRA